MPNEFYSASVDLSKDKAGLNELILISGKIFGIKLLSVYEFLKCDLACKNLVNKLVSQGFDRKLCSEICEQACLVSLCLYSTENERVFADGISVLMILTPEELRNVYFHYERLTRKMDRFRKSSLSKINYKRKMLI